MMEDQSLRLYAQFALYGQIGPNLLRCTAEMRGNLINIEFVVLDKISEDEMEDYRIASTEIIANYNDAVIDDTFTKVSSYKDLENIKPLTINIFCRSKRVK